MSAPRLTLRLTAVVLASSAVLAGCSSSTHGTVQNPATALPAAAHRSSATSVAPSPRMSSAAPDTSGLAAGGGFCAAAKAAETAQATNAAALATDTPAALQKFEQQTLSELQQFVAIAPADIRSDMTVLVSVDQKLFTALSSAHFDFRKIDPTVLSALETPQFTAAATSITTYLAKHCGISTPSS